MTGQAASVWQSEDKQSASPKALSKSVCMPFGTLAWPKCQSSIWQNHSFTFPLSPTLVPSSFLLLTWSWSEKGLSYSDTAHSIYSFIVSLQASLRQKQDLMGKCYWRSRVRMLMNLNENGNISKSGDIHKAIHAVQSVKTSLTTNTRQSAEDLFPSAFVRCCRSLYDRS